MKDLELQQYRFASNVNESIGLFFIEYQFECYTLEDEARTEKVWGETRIHSGRYEIKFRKEGGFHARYLRRFGSEFHKGMLEITDVPNFKYVLIHIGNDEDDTAGCVLVGNTANNPHASKGIIGNSKDAYVSLYPKIADHLEAGGRVFLNIFDEGDLRLYPKRPASVTLEETLRKAIAAKYAPSTEEGEGSLRTAQMIMSEIDVPKPLGLDSIVNAMNCLGFEQKELKGNDSITHAWLVEMNEKNA